MEETEVLNGREVKLIRRCYESVLPHKKEFRQLFYQTIIQSDPYSKGLFRDGFLTYDSLPDSVEMMNNFADSLFSHIDEIKAVGLKHKTYGVHPRQLPLINKAVVTAFEEFMREEFTLEMETAWFKLIEFFNHYMELGWRRK